MGVGSRRADLVHKMACILQMLWLDLGGAWPTVFRFMESVASWTTDMGTESSFSEFPAIDSLVDTYFPHFAAAPNFHDDAADEWDPLPDPPPQAPPPAPNNAAAAAAAGQAMRFSFQNALWLPGGLHTFATDRGEANADVACDGADGRQV
eukprot:3327778-Alexandrium_andersonii.AAC.1